MLRHRFGPHAQGMALQTVRHKRSDRLTACTRIVEHPGILTGSERSRHERHPGNHGPTPMTTDSVLVLLACVAVVLLGTGFALAWQRRARELAQLHAECERLRADVEAKSRGLAASLDASEKLGTELAALNAAAAKSETQIEQLRDLVKVHVARRREFDEWANPIRASLGEGIGQVMQKLKDQLARQEFAMRRQERIVAEAQDQYRGKRDELEQMRRELTLKNYHIAALNERFIRIEERMQDLTMQVAGMGGMPAAAGRAASGPDTSSGLRAQPQQSPETERFSLDADGSRDWMTVLDDWHRQLHQRFDRLEQLQARLRGTAAKPGDAPPAQPDRSDGSSAA